MLMIVQNTCTNSNLLIVTWIDVKQPLVLATNEFDYRRKSNLLSILGSCGFRNSNAKNKPVMDQIKKIRK